ncbi:Cytochrome P450 6k1 [Anopheles sinensis]|uniref:Cytochrome P450 6k1 n=1 Tax=Anopheles sinensis TaxID=74873 RepID=A0A084VLA4_ANOSI|nr:Cytochrome P450 6k1 [Anopheles sinensis]
MDRYKTGLRLKANNGTVALIMTQTLQRTIQSNGTLLARTHSRALAQKLEQAWMHHFAHKATPDLRRPNLVNSRKLSQPELYRTERHLHIVFSTASTLQCALRGDYTDTPDSTICTDSRPISNCGRTGLVRSLLMRFAIGGWRRPDRIGSPSTVHICYRVLLGSFWGDALEREGGGQRNTISPQNCPIHVRPQNNTRQGLR